MAAIKDCGGALRRNTALIQQSFMEGRISISDAKTMYNQELQSYADCMGGVNASGFIVNTSPVIQSNQTTVFSSRGTFVRTTNGSHVLIDGGKSAQFNRIVSTCRSCKLP